MLESVHGHITLTDLLEFLASRAVQRALLECMSSCSVPTEKGFDRHLLDVNDKMFDRLTDCSGTQF